MKRRHMKIRDKLRCTFRALKVGACSGYTDSVKKFF